MADCTHSPVVVDTVRRKRPTNTNADDRLRHRLLGLPWTGDGYAPRRARVGHRALAALVVDGLLAEADVLGADDVAGWLAFLARRPDRALDVELRGRGASPSGWGRPALDVRLCAIVDGGDGDASDPRVG